MRTILSIICLVALLAVTAPAQAQLRGGASEPAPAAVYEEDALQNSMSSGFFDGLFSDENFRMAHSFEMSFSSFGGEATSLGMYTNTMMWQPNDKWAARVDVSYAQDLMGSRLGLEEGQGSRVFLRNAEVAYRPNENMTFHFQMRQSPYGRYARPYGASYGAYGYRPYRRSRMPRHDLFWNETDDPSH